MGLRNMQHLQKKTMLIMLSVLHFTQFSQSGLHKVITDLSRLGVNDRPVSLAFVNKVVMDLERKGYVVSASRGVVVPYTSGRSTPGQTRYHLQDPLGLLRYIALFRRMDELRRFTLKVDADEDTITETLVRSGAVFCLGSAQSRYSAYFRPDGIEFYHADPDGLLSELRSARPGKSVLRCYSFDFDPLNGFSVDPQEPNYTTKVQTVVDMFCNNQGAYSKPLLKEIWGMDI